MSALLAIKEGALRVLPLTFFAFLLVGCERRREDVALQTTLVRCSAAFTASMVSSTGKEAQQIAGSWAKAYFSEARTMMSKEDALKAFAPILDDMRRAGQEMRVRRLTGECAGPQLAKLPESARKNIEREVRIRSDYELLVR